jgi:hypothetical protein
MMDRLSYARNGSIEPIVPAESIIGREIPGGTYTSVILDAAAAPGAGGRLHGTKAVTGITAVAEGATGHGYVTGLVQQEYGVSVLFQVGLAREYEVLVRYRSWEPHHGRVVAGRHLFYDGNQNQSYEQYINRGTLFPSTDGQWVDFRIGLKHFEFGDHQIRLSNSHNLGLGQRGLEIDSFTLVPLG